MLAQKLFIFTLLAFLVTLCVADDQSTIEVFQNLINYLSNHPLTDKSGNPTLELQNFIQDVQGENSASSAAAVAVPANKNNPQTDNSIALAAGVPASVAAAAAIPEKYGHVSSAATLTQEAAIPVVLPVTEQQKIGQTAKDIVVSAIASNTNPHIFVPLSPETTAINTLIPTENGIAPLSSTVSVTATSAQPSTTVMSTMMPSTSHSMNYTSSASASRTSTTPSETTIPVISSATRFSAKQTLFAFVLCGFTAIAIACL